jgi:hypothetical protein
MPDGRSQGKRIKKDQSGVRETRQEIAEEIRSSGTKPRLGQPNRDRARGDWDRTGSHTDEGASRSPLNEEEEPFDERE